MGVLFNCEHSGLNYSFPQCHQVTHLLRGATFASWGEECSVFLAACLPSLDLLVGGGLIIWLWLS